MQVACTPRPRRSPTPFSSRRSRPCAVTPTPSHSCPAQDALQAQRRDALLLVDDVPDRRKPAHRGVRVPAKIVPAVTEVSARQAARRRRPSPICHQSPSTTPQKRQVNPGAPPAAARRYRRHDASSANHASNSCQLLGYAMPARGCSATPRSYNLRGTEPDSQLALLLCRGSAPPGALHAQQHAAVEPARPPARDSPEQRAAISRGRTTRRGGARPDRRSGGSRRADQIRSPIEFATGQPVGVRRSRCSVTAAASLRQVVELSSLDDRARLVASAADPRKGCVHQHRQGHSLDRENSHDDDHPDLFRRGRHTGVNRFERQQGWVHRALPRSG